VGLLSEQTLLAAETACAMAENSGHALAELNDFMADGLVTLPECRHIRGHLALENRLAEDQCSVTKWLHRSATRVGALVENYRLRLQTRPGGDHIPHTRKQKAALASGLETNVARQV
jgi:hypothetical protein